MNKKHIVMLIIFVGGFWGGNEIFKIYMHEPEANAAAAAVLDHKTPDFTLPDLDGVNHSIREWDGKVVVLNFWATWCPPCRKETPMFVELQEELGAQGLQFIGIAIDNKEKVTDFVDTFGVNYPMLIGGDNAIKVSKAYGNRYGALPYTVVINRAGVVTHVQRGEFTRELVNQKIRPLL